MQRFFFHLRNSSDLLLDPEGMLMPSDAVPGAALRQARDCIAGDAHTGRLDLHYRIDVHDEAGEVIHSLDFKDAVEFAPAH